MAGLERSDRKHAKFVPGRGKRPSKAATLGAATTRKSVPRGASPGAGWKALKRAVTFRSCAAHLSVPAGKNWDEERVHKSAGSAVRACATSDRWDVQNMYRKMFFLPDACTIGETDPWNHVHDTEPFWGGSMPHDRAVSRKHRDRMHVLSTLKRKLKRTLVSLNEAADWSKLFEHYDADGSGGLGLEELVACIRFDAGVSDDQLSDHEVVQLFEYINSDGSGEISAEDFVKFMDTPMPKTRVKLPVTSNANRNTPRRGSLKEKSVHQPTAWLQQFSRPQQKAQPFVAEYITTARVPLRADSFVDSKVIGYLEKDEVVAVTHVWGGNELKCHRLRWCDPRRGVASGGWTSHRGRLHPKDRISDLLIRLTRDEWSAVFQHHTSIADRVSALEARASLTKKLPLPTNASHDAAGDMSEAALTTGQKVPGINSNTQITSALEKNGPKEAAVATPQDPEQRRIVRVYASIDRALVLHKIAASKLEYRTGREAVRDTTCAISNLTPALPSAMNVDYPVITTELDTTAAPAGPSAGGTKAAQAKSDLLCSRSSTCCASSSLRNSSVCSVTPPPPADSADDTIASSSQGTKLPQTPTTLHDKSICTNSSWNPTPPPASPAIARRSSPPPRAGRSNRS